jgi:hypothetical protein
MPNKRQNNRPIIVNMTQKSKQAKKKKKTPVGALIRALGTAGGGALGGYFGNAALGGAAGRQLGALTSKWLGFGAYRVSQNSILKTTNGVPGMHSNSQSVIVRHKEYIGPILSHGTFSVQYALPLNPAMPSFPWLSGVAARYQEYAIKGMVFHYVPASGSAISGTSPSLGTVMLQTTYRASDINPTSKAEMLNEFCASEGVPSEAFIHPIECDPKENPFNIHYCRSVAPPTGEPLMSYDLGKTFVATQGQLADGNTLGDLWVTYEIELKKPVISNDVTPSGYAFMHGSVASGSDIFHTPSVVTGNLAVTATGNVITIPANVPSCFIAVDFRGSSFSTFAWTPGATIVNGVRAIVNDQGEADICTDVASGAAQAMFAIVVNQTDPTLPTTVTISGFSYAGTPGTAQLSVFVLKGPVP